MGIHYMPTDGGSWTEIPAGDAKYYDSSSETWKVIKKGYYMPTDGGSWTQFYTGSDPITFTMIPFAFSTYPTRFARGTSWGTSSNGPAGGTEGTKTLACGRYFTGSNTQRYYGIMSFYNTSRGTLLQDELDERPVVKSATLRLTRDTVTHGVSNPGSGAEIFISHYNGSSTSSNPDPGSVALSNAANQSAVGLTRGSNITVDLMAASNGQGLIEDFAANSHLAVTNVDTGLTNYGASLDNDYFWFFGLSNASYYPTVTIQLDYT